MLKAANWTSYHGLQSKSLENTPCCLCTREPPGGAAGCEAATVVWGACQVCKGPGHQAETQACLCSAEREQPSPLLPGSFCLSVLFLLEKGDLRGPGWPQIPMPKPWWEGAHSFYWLLFTLLRVAGRTKANGPACTPTALGLVWNV